MNHPLRILFLTDAFPPHAYGSGWSTYHLARGLRAQGHSVRIVLAHAGVSVEQTTYDDFPVWRAPAHSRAYNPAFLSVTGLGPGRATRQIIRTWRPDVVHAQHVQSVLVAQQAARTTPTIITVRDHWPNCFYGTALSDARCPACLQGTWSPCNARRGSVDVPRPLHTAKAVTMRLMLRQRQDALRRAGGVIAASEAIRQELTALVSPDRLFTIPNAVDLSAFAETDTPAVVDLPDRFSLYVGKLSAHKGADLLPEIVRQLGDDAPPLLVLGDGEEAAALRTSDVSGSRLRLLGVLPNTSVVALMRRAIALVTPARWPEPLSRTHLEALAAGCPIIATDTGGTREIVEPGVTGFLTAVGDTQAMADHLRALTRDDTLRHRMAAASRERSARLFSLDAVATANVAVYTAAIKRMRGETGENRKDSKSAKDAKKGKD